MYRYRFISDETKNFKTKTVQYPVKAKVWVYSGAAGWYFVTIPVGTSKKIKKRFGYSARGWGSLPVLVSLGKTSWKTSIFPDKKAGAYLLPLKAEIRKKEAIQKGGIVKFSLSLNP